MPHEKNATTTTTATPPAQAAHAAQPAKPAWPADANVFFIGLMGAGKTTVGRAIARRLNRLFVDSDHEIETRTGARIPVIFELEGEAGFRVREAQAISELTRRKGIVLATGGGAVLRPENRQALAARGVVVYLRASAHDLWLRTRRDRSRPLLQTEDPRARLEALYAARDPLYREIADLVIDTANTSSINALVHTVLAQLEQAGVQATGIPAIATPVMPPPHSPAHDAQCAKSCGHHEGKAHHEHDGRNEP
jgi:shikimate kinase